MKNFYILVGFFGGVIPVSVNIIQFSTAIVALSQVDRGTSSGFELRLQISKFCSARDCCFICCLGRCPPVKNHVNTQINTGPSSACFVPLIYYLSPDFVTPVLFIHDYYVYRTVFVYFMITPRYICMRGVNRTFIFQILTKSTS